MTEQWPASVTRSTLSLHSWLTGRTSVLFSETVPSADTAKKAITRSKSRGVGGTRRAAGSSTRHQPGRGGNPDGRTNRNGGRPLTEGGQRLTLAGPAGACFSGSTRTGAKTSGDESSPDGVVALDEEQQELMGNCQC